ncbi:hypothetical protein [Nocardia mexicana]|uniref:Uncharacterized protein n=1 Tax=Nocardia mexicana TaxID=279262 RepID=A0A370HEQ8_9NOCA|nr:hypothetical protein [Nocardia mexicana]RDI55276.1 hypothetical protein DFR68_101109 [Nocardia mexicana]
MTTNTRSRWVAVVIAVVAGIGLIDAATGRTWDLVAVFGVIVVLGSVSAASHWAGRPSITLRRDLARWLAIRAADSGEAADRIADRAVAAYRAGLTDDREPL